MKRQYSVRVFFIVMSVVLVLPFAAICLFFSFSMMEQVMRKDQESNENTLSIYCRDLETKMEMIEQTLIYNWQDVEYQMIAYPLSDLQAHLSTWNIWNEYVSMQRLYADIGAMAVYSEVNDVCRCTYCNDYSTELRNVIQRYSRELDFYEACNGWVPMQVKNKYFLVHTFGTENAYSACFIDPERTNGFNLSKTAQNESCFYFYDAQKGLLAEGEQADVLKEMLQTDVTSGKLLLRDTRYSMAEYQLNERLTVLYITKKINFISSVGTGQLIAFVATFLMLLIVPLVYFVVSRTFFSPFLEFRSTMTKIRNGGVEEKLQYDGRLAELHEFRNTFNEMMEEIEDLRIDSYEKELSRQKAQLQVLQGQLKPHFYLNCLKTLYSMLQINNTEKSLQMILWISEMLRYRFRNIGERIPLVEEMEQVKIYGNMQNLNSIYRVKLTFDLPANVLRYMVPMLCVQTFVENACKYARIIDHELVVEVSAMKTETDGETFLAIGIQDNGNGFPEKFTDGSWMQDAEQFEKGTATGIYNMWSRLKLLYGEKAGIIFMNNAIGGFCQLIFPVDEKF